MHTIYAYIYILYMPIYLHILLHISMYYTIINEKYAVNNDNPFRHAESIFLPGDFEEQKNCLEHYVLNIRPQMSKNGENVKKCQKLPATF